MAAAKMKAAVAAADPAAQAAENSDSLGGWTTLVPSLKLLVTVANMKKKMMDDKDLETVRMGVNCRKTAMERKQRNDERP